jgi:hypothetical protein
MLNSKKRHNSLTEEKVYVLYKDNPCPARVIDVEKRGRKIYLLLRWENFGNEQFKPEKWVREALCKEYKPEGPQTPSYKAPGRMALNWWQKLVVKFQNWWYGEE